MRREQHVVDDLREPVGLVGDDVEQPLAHLLAEVEVGAAKVVGTDAGRVVAEAARLLTDPAAYRAMTAAENPFGDGRAAERIAEVLDEQLVAGDRP